MRLFEIETKTRTQTKTKTKATIDTDAYDRAFRDQAAGTQNVPTTQTPTDNPVLKPASKASTRQKVSQVQMPASASAKMAALMAMDIDNEISDDEAYAIAGMDTPDPTPPPPSTMPATITKSIATATSVDPEWHQVKHLPGYIQQPIRALGRQVFKTFTTTPVEDIQTLANIGGGPNTVRELNAVAGWLKKNATKVTDGTIDFDKSMPDYEAKYQVYTYGDHTFKLVKDFAGIYIYAWPSADDVTLPSAQKKLPSR